MKVEVAVLGSPSLIILMASVDIKQLNLMVSDTGVSAAERLWSERC